VTQPQLPALGAIYRRRKDGLRVRVHSFYGYYVMVQLLAGQKHLTKSRPGKIWHVKVESFPLVYCTEEEARAQGPTHQRWSKRNKRK